MEQTYDNIATWVQGQLLRGRHIFSQEEVWKVFPTITHENVTRSLTRLCSRKILMTPIQGFYVILPTDFRLKGITPPVFYIDQLMRFMGRQYYVGLLNAAKAETEYSENRWKIIDNHHKFEKIVPFKGKEIINHKLTQGTELGKFLFGGSDVVLFFEPGRAPRITPQTVKVGEKID